LARSVQTALSHKMNQLCSGPSHFKPNNLSPFQKSSTLSNGTLRQRQSKRREKKGKADHDITMWSWLVQLILSLRISRKRR
ncbi:unnamed protein product, partial [Brassica oleracea]